MTKSWPMRTAKVAIVVLLILGLLLIIFPGYVAAIVGPTLARLQGWRALSQAKTTDELRVAVGYLGGYFSLKDGSWVAIRYSDSHAYPGYSSAVALDSGGKWFSSSHHFCGRFRNFFMAGKQLREMAEATGNDEEAIQRTLEQDYGQIFALATATNLTSARAQLLALGFEE